MSIVYVLFADDNRYLSVYSSKDELAKGVDYWMEILPNQTLSYAEQQVNYSPEANCWGWAYIYRNDGLNNLTKGGANFIPRKHYWGHNLIHLDIAGFNTHCDLSKGETP